MAKDLRELYCATCRSREQHVALDSRGQRQILREKTGRAPDGFWMCIRPGCRNVRTYWEDEPFDEPFRMPPHV
ncbi:hypothetical protein AB0B21_34635 [Streptomyces rimosus]|uniref:hypothetical protein n=1 Tax=Streptomyces rimosus TaxID=1927 RepID=UPI000518E1E7|nr:hypothetical protein [Streptomyces rimosus]